MSGSGGQKPVAAAEAVAKQVLLIAINFGQARNYYNQERQ